MAPPNIPSRPHVKDPRETMGKGNSGKRRILRLMKSSFQFRAIPLPAFERRRKPNEAFRLLDLPREVRDHILKFMVKEFRLTISLVESGWGCDGGEEYDDYFPRRSPVYNDVALPMAYLLICKQFTVEVTETFFRETRVVVRTFHESDMGWYNKQFQSLIDTYQPPLSRLSLNTVLANVRILLFFHRIDPLLFEGFYPERLQRLLVSMPNIMEVHLVMELRKLYKGFGWNGEHSRCIIFLISYLVNQLPEHLGSIFHSDIGRPDARRFVVTIKRHDGPSRSTYGPRPNRKLVKSSSGVLRVVKMKRIRPRPFIVPTKGKLRRRRVRDKAVNTIQLVLGKFSRPLGRG